MTAVPDGSESTTADPSDDAVPLVPGHLVEVTARLRAIDVERLDIAAARRGIARDEMLAQAVDAFLAREIWSGGFIAPPPAMEPPPRIPWGPKAFRLRRRD